MDLSLLLNTLIWILLLILVGYGAWWFFKQAGLPQPAMMIIGVIFGVACLIIFVALLSGGLSFPRLIR